DAHIVFGVDGGGSGCRVAVCDASGKRLGELSGGPANVTSDRDQALGNISKALTNLLQACAISEDQMRASVAHVGLAGVISKADEEAVLAALPFAHAVVTDDRETSLVGALGEGFGVLAAIGTGTIIASRSASGTRAFGGWGLHISDQASGAWLGQEALKRCVLAQDGLVAHSDLTQSLMSEHGGELVAMVTFARSAEPKDFAVYAKRVIESARAGDANGVALMCKGAAYLTSCLEAAAFQEDDILCLSGGVGPHYKDYLDAPYRSCIQPPRGTALDGALQLARQLRIR
ncbi:unnamed protein product, partial [Ectocarpus sp. 12 AP-2014]